MILNFVRDRLNSQNFLDPSEEPSGFLTVVYIAALSFIALLALMSHLLIVQMTGAQKETAEIVYIAGRQRVTAQQIAIHASNYMNSRDEKDEKLLENAYFSFKLGHNYLIRGSLESEEKSVVLSPALYKIYFDEPVNLHHKAQKYTELVDGFLELDKEDPQSFEKLEILSREISEKAAGDMIQALDIAAQQFQEETLSKINTLSLVQTIVFIVLLITLLLEAMFIFRPLVIHVRRYSQQLLDLALKDALTGLNNRRAFMQAAEAELSRARRHNHNLCVVLSDIDKFKSVNDTYGHAAGDDVLKHLADILEKTFRKEDIIGRIGGEEFAFVLPETNAEQGEKLIEKLRQRIENSPCDIEDDNGQPFALKYTSSFGLVPLSNEHETVDSLLKRADTALYEAKEAGRNRVVVAKDKPKENTLKAV